MEMRPPNRPTDAVAHRHPNVSATKGVGRNSVNVANTIRWAEHCLPMDSVRASVDSGPGLRIPIFGYIQEMPVGIEVRLQNYGRGSYGQCGSRPYEALVQKPRGRAVDPDLSCHVIEAHGE